MGLVLCMPLLLLNYTFPLIVSFPLNSNVTQWGLSSSTLDLTKIMRTEATDWIWILAVIGAISATFAQLSSAIMSFSRVIWAASKSGGKFKHYPTIVSEISWRRHTGTIRPIASIILAGTVGVLLTLMEFGVIVQLYLVARIINLFSLYSTLIRLRYIEVRKGGKKTNMPSLIFFFLSARHSEAVSDSRRNYCSCVAGQSHICNCLSRHVFCNLASLGN